MVHLQKMEAKSVLLYVIWFIFTNNMTKNHGDLDKNILEYFVHKTITVLILVMGACVE